jgi:hypothetical protein
MAALRGVLAVLTEVGQLLIESLDGSFFLAKDFLYQLVRGHNLKQELGADLGQRHVSTSSMAIRS